MRCLPLPAIIVSCGRTAEGYRLLEGSGAGRCGGLPREGLVAMGGSPMTAPGSARVSVCREEASTVKEQQSQLCVQWWEWEWIAWRRRLGGGPCPQPALWDDDGLAPVNTTFAR